MSPNLWKEPRQRTTPTTMTAPIEVREERDAMLVATIIIRSSWVMTAASLLDGATVEAGPQDGVAARAGRVDWAIAELSHH